MNTFNTKYGLVTLLKNERFIGDAFKNGNYWDEDTLFKLKKYINPDKNILEIGGHCGTSTIVYASYLNNNSKIFVYEPQEIMFKLLNKNITQNNLQDKIISYNSGVFCYEGIGIMNNIDLDGGGGLVNKRYNEENDLLCNFGGIGLGNDGETIQLTTIDSMKLSNVGFIHCDAQGSESYIFYSSLNTININKPFILYENNKAYSKFLYDQVSTTYPEYKNKNEIDIKDYCINKLNYTSIDKFNNSIDDLLIPPQENFNKIIHITNKNIDEKLIKIKQQWEQLNPDYKIELYDDERCLIFLEKYFGKKYCDIFNFIEHGQIKADFFRVCILYVYGGIYADADIEPYVSLKEFVPDDIEFMTCISYNYNTYQTYFSYNPHFIVSKKYNFKILEIISKYEILYNNRTKVKYDYWKWSICSLFTDIHKFEIQLDTENTFIINNKKYAFLIEEIKILSNNKIFNFYNF